MSITLSESLLSSDQWTALGTLVEDAVFALTLYAWNPLLTTSLSGSMARDDFDAVVYNGDVVRLSSSGALGLNGAPLGSYSDPDGATFGVPPSLVVDTDLYACVITATGISQAAYNGAWSSWAEIVTDSTVAYVAATAADTVHYVTFDGTHYQFHVWVSGTVTDSDIYWGFPLLSFGARRLNGKDVLAFIGNTPGTPSAKTENLKVVKYILPVGVVGVFTYQYGSWSDHIELDRIDQWSSFRYRSHLKLSVIDSTLWLTCYSSEGTAKAPITGTRVYSSKDGTHWSRGELLALARSGEWGLSLQRLGTTLYALGRSGGSSAPSTLWFGTPDPSTVLSLSPYVHQLTVNRRDMQQLSTVLDNADNWIAGSLLGQSRTFALLFSTGFWLGSSQILQPQGLFEVDSVEPAKDQPQQRVQLTARDHLAWMATKTQSEQFVNWLPQGLGLDAYIDATGTGYGGMAHTAPADGTWKAHDNTLFLTTGNASGLAYSTYLFDAWNGSVQSHFGLASASNNEYAGLIFRSQDKDNGYAYYYDQVSDKLRLERWSAGIRTLIWQSSAKSWGSIASRYLRADFRYSRIRLYSSAASPAVSANITWTLEHSLVVEGFTDAATADSGYVGSLGKGFSDLDTWNAAPDPIGAGTLPPWIDPYTPSTPLIIPAATGVLATELWVMAAGEAKAARVRIDTLGNQTADDRSTGLLAPASWFNSNPWEFDEGFAYTKVGGGIEHIARQGDGFTTWDLRMSNAALWGDSARYTWYGRMSHLVNGQGLAVEYAQNYRALTSDAWRSRTLVANSEGFDYYAMAPHNANVWYATKIANTGGWVRQIWRSSNGGLTFPDKVFETPTNPRPGVLVIPYKRAGGIANVEGEGFVLYLAHNLRDLARVTTVSGVMTFEWVISGGFGGDFVSSVGVPDSYPPPVNPLDTYTHDAAIAHWAIRTHAFGGTYLEIGYTPDSFATMTVLSGLLGGAEVTNVEGWPPNSNCLLWHYDNGPGEGGRATFTLDNLTTFHEVDTAILGWIRGGDARIAYCEFRLATVQ